jgi:murein DD-endopeptidase MepM/ murein hydrolase activator NlpD
MNHYPFILFSGLYLFTMGVHAFPVDSRVPGGIALIPIEQEHSSARFTFNNKPVLMGQKNGQNVAVVGLPLNLKPGEHSISAELEDSKARIRKFFEVVDKQYTTQRINIKNKRKVNPYKKDMQRISTESKRKRIAANHWDSRSPDLDFLTPVDGIMTGSYGKRRIFNGQARRPHSGMDIAADTGVAVVSPSDGVVIESGDFFFSGNIVYIHHGQGLITLFAHLDRIDVSVGEQVKKGQVIGTVGATGRVTGPHLHWSIGLNGSWIDPALFIPAQDR